jgi:E3 ubiquitin-protein ligase UBR4
VRDANYTYTIHDLKHLLIKFALEKSFSDDSGGGGRESNMYIVPYMMHMALYVINTYVLVCLLDNYLVGVFKYFSILLRYVLLESASS